MNWSEGIVKLFLTGVFEGGGGFHGLPIKRELFSVLEHGDSPARG